MNVIAGCEVDIVTAADREGAVERAFAAVDWTRTPVGAPAGWPAELVTMVRALLGSRFSMWMAWGRELTFFYNDAYARDTLGRKHTWALGRPASEAWSEIWPEMGPRIQSVIEHGTATVTERNPRLPSEGRLIEAVAGMAGLSAEQGLERLAAELLAPGQAADDVALVLLRAAPIG